MVDPITETTTAVMHPTRDGFTETCWMRVRLAAAEDGSVAARQALEALCQRYWPSIYSFLRRKGHRPAEAEDLTQGFFGSVLEAKAFARADPEHGRFRNFLLGALTRFLVDEAWHHRAQKRGGGQAVLSLDFQGVEERYQQEADPGLTAEQAYDRRWAATVLEEAFGQIELEFREAGQGARFDHLKQFLSAPAGEGDYEALGTALDITPNAVAVAVRRLRERYRELVGRKVKATVTNPADLDEELSELFR